MVCVYMYMHVGDTYHEPFPRQVFACLSLPIIGGLEQSFEVLTCRPRISMVTGTGRYSSPLGQALYVVGI